MNRTILTIVTLVAITTLLLPTRAFACGIEGTAVRSDGSKVDHTARISTSWNSTVAIPANGTWSMDLGSSACGQSVTLYVDGNHNRTVSIPANGNARVDLTIR